MSKKTLIIITITVISIIELILVKPIIPAFFGMNTFWKIIYLISFFGFPLLIIIPSAFIVLPFAAVFKRDKSFKSVWLNYFKNTFLVFGIVLLIMNSLLFISKFALGNDPFPLQKYSEIKGFEGDLEDVRIGRFKSPFGTTIRSENQQIEKYDNGDSSVLNIEWRTNSEYRLINQSENLGMNDTLDVTITSNNSEFYECYLRFGEYAEYMKIYKE